MPEPTPKLSKPLTIEDVRLFLLDRSAADNELDRDLSFSDPEIEEAMVRCAREYNSIPPFVGNLADPARLPADGNTFLHGIAWQIYLAALARLSRNDFTYEAGGVQVAPKKDRIKNFQALVKYHKEEFENRVRQYKTHYNLTLGWGCVG